MIYNYYSLDSFLSRDAFYFHFKPRAKTHFTLWGLE